MSSRSLKIIGVAAAALLLASCSTPSSSSSPGAAESTDGGVAVVALSDEPDTLDPTIANTFVARVVFTSMCEKLYDANENLEIIPQLAAELPITSADGLSVDIPLREGILFNDGTPFNAEAVKTTLDRNITLDTSSRKKELAAVESISVVDENTVRLTLSQPFSPLGAQLADRAGAIMSPTALAALGDDFGTDPVCVGPFDFTDRVAGSEINLAKSDYYYDKDKVKLDGVTYTFITDPNVRSANLRSGEVNAAERLNASDVETLETDQKVEVLKADTIAYQSLSINVDPALSASPLASNPDLRRALELSINRDALNDVVFNGQVTPDCAPLPLQMAYRPEDITCSKFDPDEATKILEESGETLPVPVELLIPARPTDQKSAEVIQQMANDVGFDVTIKPVEFVSALDAARAGQFEMFLIGWSGRIDPDGDLNDLVTTGGANNFNQLADPELDGLIAAAAAVTDTDERQKLYGEALDRLDELKANIYLYHDSWFLGLSGITGVEYSSDAIPRFKTASLTE
ncbi:ABC transporter substrate-binding protein [Glaciibacter superstes]|uniref:ABC transporter substrate-binding protein n=1 Tax=Glaciibacter superstes TaxID=501023 RepID=UPI0003B49976|nr:ABC transporter substrate-binding protein [Glaciibacter superstes]